MTQAFPCSSGVASFQSLAAEASLQFPPYLHVSCPFPTGCHTFSGRDPPPHLVYTALAMRVTF